MNHQTRVFLQEDDYYITVESQRYDANSRWTISVSIHKGEQRLLPPRKDNDNSYATLDSAEDAGIKLGRALIAGLRR